MKLIIQVPCLNEADQLPTTLRSMPTAVDGFSAVEVLVIDDGSTDGTAEIARACGAHHIVRLPAHKGLAMAFQAGLDAALKLGADVIVNTDADGQYDSAAIPELVKPVVAGEADVVVGDRGVGSVAEFSWIKRQLQRVGSRVVAGASGFDVPDATSGFRAYSREAALQMVLVTNFTYTLETLILAGHSSISVDYIPIERRHVERPSRLFRSNWDYVRRSIAAIGSVYTFYRPLRLFAAVGGLLVVASFAAWTPFLIDWARGDGRGHIQSVVLGAVLMIAAVQVIGLGIIADLLGRQRVLSMKTLERVRRIELQVGVPPSHYDHGNPPPPAPPAA